MTTSITMCVLRALSPLIGDRCVTPNSQLVVSLGLRLPDMPTVRDYLNREFMQVLNEPITLDEVLAARTVKDLINLVYYKTEPDEDIAD